MDIIDKLSKKEREVISNIIADSIILKEKFQKLNKEIEELKKKLGIIDRNEKKEPDLETLNILVEGYLNSLEKLKEQNKIIKKLESELFF